MSPSVKTSKQNDAFDAQTFLDSAGVSRRIAKYRRADVIFAQGDLWVSNSLSGCRWQLNQLPAVRYPPYVVKVRTGYRVSAHDGERRVALQGRVAPCRAVVDAARGQLPLFRRRHHGDRHDITDANRPAIRRTVLRALAL